MEYKNQRSNWLTQIGVGPPFRRAAISQVRVSSVRVSVRIRVSGNIRNGGLSEWRAGTPEFAWKIAIKMMCCWASGKPTGL